MLVTNFVLIGIGIFFALELSDAYSDIKELDKAEYLQCKEVSMLEMKGNTNEIRSR